MLQTTPLDAFHGCYCDWIEHLTEIRERMEALRDETFVGWRAPPTIANALTALNHDDERYAAFTIDAARQILIAAERDAESTKAHRLARIERYKERIGALEQAYNAGWRPLAGLKWPEPAVVAWCGMFSAWRFYDLDSLETIVGNFEALFADYRSTMRHGFGGYTMPHRTKFRRK